MGSKDTAGLFGFGAALENQTIGNQPSLIHTSTSADRKDLWPSLVLVTAPRTIPGDSRRRRSP